MISAYVFGDTIEVHVKIYHGFLGWTWGLIVNINRHGNIFNAADSSLTVETVIETTISKAMDAVLKKMEEGKKLSMEDLVVLMMGLFRETKNSVDKMSNRIDEVINMVMNVSDKVDKRIDVIMNMVVDMNNRIDKRIEESNKRIDMLYDLLGKIYNALIKDAVRQGSS